jgi:hypothetical protein
MRCLPSSIYLFFAMSQFDWHIIHKKMKPWRLFKVEGFVLKYRVPHLWPTYISERRTSFAKAYQIKVRGYWELFEEHVRNLRTLELPPPGG